MLSNGFRAAAHVKPLLPWYACLLVLGLLQTWPLWAGNTLRNPQLAELAGGGLDALVDLLLDNQAGLAEVGSWIGALVPLALLSALLYSFFAGGVLGVYTGARSFWAGCRRFWLPFTGLGFIVFALALLLGALAVLPALAAGGGAAAIVALLVLWLLNVLGEYARAIGVVGDQRNPFVLLGSSSAFCARHLGGVLALALLASLLYALLAGAYMLLARLLGASPLLLVLQQLFVFGALWIKALRLALAARYVMAQPSPRDELIRE